MNGSIYRRNVGSQVWHTNPRCASWPLLNFKEQPRPAVGKVCPKCIELEASRTASSRAGDPMRR